MMPSVNPKPLFTSCNLASGDTSASSAGSSLTMVGLSPCACALAAQTPRVAVNRIAAEIEKFFIRRPSNPTMPESRRDLGINLLARWTISKHPERLLSRAVRGRVRGPAREVEAIRHAVRLGVAGVQGAQAEERSAEFQQAHVRMQHPGDVAALRIRAEHQAAD